MPCPIPVIVHPGVRHAGGTVDEFREMCAVSPGASRSLTLVSDEQLEPAPHFGHLSVWITIRSCAVGLEDNP